MNIPHSSPWVSKEDISAVSVTLRKGMIAQGSLAREFEKQCADYIGLPYTWSTGSGQAALITALFALGVMAGSEVVLPSYVCHAVADAIYAVGAIPIYCDVGDDWCLNFQTVSVVLSPKTAAIVAVHAFGIFADIKPLLELGIPIIEDCCQCFSPRVGNIGQIAVFSFHATKCLTTGEGGMLATSNLDIAEQITTHLKSQSQPSRLSDLQAALGLSQLRRYEKMLEIRQTMAVQYLNTLPIHLTVRIKTLVNRSIFFRFPLSLDRCFETISKLFIHQGIQVRRGVDTLLHREAGLHDLLFPTSVELFNTTMSLPFYPSLNDSDRQKVLTNTMDILK